MAAPRRVLVHALASTVLIALTLASRANAHEHHEDEIPEGEAISPEPLDAILWIHILVQIFAWGILFPTGMVLGIIRSKWHVPVQVLGTALAVAGYYLGHKHKGRQFSHTAHSSFAPYLNFALFAQVVLGAYLRLHIERGFLAHVRKWLVVTHGVIGKALPVAAWVQMLFGGITALGFCQGDHLGQCAAHFIMGSAFIGYGIILMLLLLVGQYWLARRGKSQEFFDSLIIAVWGCVNTFTEHHWGTAWVRNDLQHTTMGIVWWCAGLVGIWLSSTRDGRPKRNVIPGIVILLTGYAMSAHPQELHLSTAVHSFFGYTLMAAGLARIIEVSFVLRDRAALSMDGSDPGSWQYICPFLLMASGFLFMGATEEQMIMLAGANVSHVAYILILYSVAFLVFLFTNILLHLYALHAFPAPTQFRHTRRAHQRHHSTHAVDEPDADVEAGPFANGQAHGQTNGSAAILSKHEARAMRDAQEFELDALISSDEEGEKKEALGNGKVRL